MPNQHRIDSGTSDSTQAKPAFWIQVGVPALILPRIQPLSFSSVIGSPPKAPNRPTVITSGMTICIVVTPKLPRPALMPSAVPCSRLGKKVLMLDIETGEVAAAHARPQRHQLEGPQRPVLVLQRDAGADGRGQQHRGGQEDGVAPAGQADQERRRDAHRRAGDAGDGRQREQLGLGEGEAQVEHLHGDDAPHAPDREAAQQRRHRDPQVAVGDLLAGAFPEGVVFGAPVGDVGAAGAQAGALAAGCVMRCSMRGRSVRQPAQRLKSLALLAHDLGACAPRSSTSRSARPRPRRTSA